MTISQNVTIEPNNLLLVGGSGSGKTRYFIKPFITQSQSPRYISVSVDYELNDLIKNNVIYYEEEVDATILKQNITDDKNIIFNFNIADDSKNYIIENNLRSLVELFVKEKQKTTYLIIDEACCFDLTFIDTFKIKQLNKNNVYVIYIVQNIAQLKAWGIDFEKMFNVHLFFGSQELSTLQFYKQEDPHINFDDCFVYMNGEIKKDKKLEPIDTTKLRLLRIKANMTQTELAINSGVSLRNIRAIEQDVSKIQKLQALNLYKLANALNCKMEDLLEL